MPEFPVDKDFLNHLTAVVEANMSNEQFGVSELAEEMNMSRSNLLRRVKKLTNLSVSQLISQVRLKRGMDLLKTSSLNVSEVSHQVGFSSTSYFIKCFRERYGYPPGEVGKRISETGSAGMVAETPHENRIDFVATSDPRRKFILFGSAALVVIAVVASVIYYSNSTRTASHLEKSIAVLPFKNDSNDSTNLYLINGLMEATLTNLQKIADLRVISRTSSEKYRNTNKSIPEMAKELNVSYFVEGSGQKIGNEIVLNIQLIEASSDRHLWSRQYKRQATGIFDLQQEISKNIAEEIQAIITPDEETRITKKPTEDVVAYDLYLKGVDLLFKTGRANLEEAITHFKKAVARDPEFALAYAQMAITYYYLDIFKADKKYTAELSDCADKAVLYDPKLGESLIAKALFYMNRKEYQEAVPYLEKALEYNPNSFTVIGFLSDFYANFIPNTSKYLEYALMGVKRGIGSQDSAQTSYSYLRLANALIQLGFVDEALRYIDRSLDYNPKNPFSNYVRPFILYAKNRDWKQTRAMLITEFNKDTTRFDILQDIGKVNYMLRDYQEAYKYYKRFLRIRETGHLEVYRHENLTIAFVLAKTGHKEKAEELINNFKEYSEHDQTIYKHAGLAGYYGWRGDTAKVIEHMRLFSKEENFQYWMLLWNDDPAFEMFKGIPEVKRIMDRMETKFWQNHDEISVRLAEKGLLSIPEKVNNRL